MFERKVRLAIMEPLNKENKESLKEDYSLVPQIPGMAVNKLIELGVALTGESSLDVLLTNVLRVAIDLTRSEGGTIYTVSDDDQQLQFSVAINHPLNISIGGVFGEVPQGMATLPLYRDGCEEVEELEPNLSNIACYVWHFKEIVNIEDAYATKDFDMSGVKRFDESNNYYTKSIISVPISNRMGRIICILQMINCRDESGRVVSFSHDDSDERESHRADQGFLLRAVASQAAIAIENRDLLDGERKLWESLIQMMASLIDKKSLYTGGHCQRVPVLTEMIARAANEAKFGTFSDFKMDENDMYELKVAAWLHDIGKVTTPEYVVDKGTKLETIYNRMHEVRMRFEVLLRDNEIRYWKEIAEGKDPDLAKKQMEQENQRLYDDFAFIGECNIGGEFLDEVKIQRLKDLSKRKWKLNFDKKVGIHDNEISRMNGVKTNGEGVYEYLLEDSQEDIVNVPGLGGEHDVYNLGDIYNLSIAKGTLTPEERKKIEEHVSVTISVLSKLPLPRHLRRMVEFAGGHHERMDGKGYPFGLTGDQLSVPARMMAVADVFEALSAADRPYRPRKTLSECMKILGFMSKEGHIDPDIYVLFIESKLWDEYANKYLEEDQLDIPDADEFIKKTLNR